MTGIEYLWGVQKMFGPNARTIGYLRTLELLTSGDYTAQSIGRHMDMTSQGVHNCMGRLMALGLVESYSEEREGVVKGRKDVFIFSIAPQGIKLLEQVYENLAKVTELPPMFTEDFNCSLDDWL